MPLLLAPTSIEGEWLVRWTIRLALVLYASSVALRLVGRPNFLAARLWLSAWLVYLVHVLAAFHVYHHWAHAAAFRHTEMESGFGPGLFISYGFTLLWGLDACWWNLLPANYLRRPPWMEWLLQGFFAFILFNGAVIFVRGPMRWVSLAVSVALLVLLCRSWYGRWKQ